MYPELRNPMCRWNPEDLEDLETNLEVDSGGGKITWYPDGSAKEHSYGPCGPRYTDSLGEEC